MERKRVSTSEALEILIAVARRQLGQGARGVEPTGSTGARRATKPIDAARLRDSLASAQDLRKAVLLSERLNELSEIWDYLEFVCEDPQGDPLWTIYGGLGRADEIGEGLDLSEALRDALTVDRAELDAYLATAEGVHD